MSKTGQNDDEMIYEAYDDEAYEAYEVKEDV
jgi:hypothetical protein